MVSVNATKCEETMRHSIAICFVLFLGLFVTFAYAQGTSVEDNVKRGHALALLICSACHVVASDQEATPILREPAPSFQDIANRPGATADSLKSFLTTTHATIATSNNMPNPQLVDYQIAALTSYILSLRQEY